MARRLPRALLLAVVVWGAAAGILGAASDPPPTDPHWRRALPGEDDIFKSCEYTASFRFSDIFGRDNDWRKFSAVVNYYRKSNKAQSLGCTADQRNETETSVSCPEQPICKQNGKDRDPACSVYSDDFTCPKCNGTLMTEHYCARLCTQWFVRQGQSGALQRYGVIAALRKGEECWCTPFGGARDDAQTDYADDKPRSGGRFVDDYDKVKPYPCKGDANTTCGGQLGSEELETAVKIYCHTSLRLLFVAVAPFVFRVLDCFFGFCCLWRLKCHRCCGGMRDSDTLPSRAFTMTMLCGGRHNAWRDAVEMNDMSPKSACVLAAIRLMCYVSQPVIFVGLLGHYAMQKEMIGPTQTKLGCAVAVREGVYLIMLGCCVCWKPSFLLINNKASVLGSKNGDQLHQGGIFLLLMILAPEKFVAQVLFQPGGLSSSRALEPGARVTVVDYQRRAKSINVGYFTTLSLGLLIDLCAFWALYQGYIKAQLPWSLSFGYFITTGRVAWMLMVVLSEVWNDLRKRLCRPTKERNLSDSLNAPLNDATDASGTQRM